MVASKSKESQMMIVVPILHHTHQHLVKPRANMKE